ncbi:hypothetical protein J8C06_01675 [Chloracidobacterium validum]|uniref:4-vinyl reductase 4VR domain-containing protein n=1 Tax=Chloracidobacterium validum TaxID=2821543 RepID=A0ABX8BC19_9BACT|nr:hypothetical protein [Chloracidobacterium validum]QUW03179.1 hypothetical protein J8C06_01675 [Chloracidobacterium validum]
MTAPAAAPLLASDRHPAWWPADLIIAIHVELARLLPDDMARVLYRLGRRTGARFLQAHHVTAAADTAVLPVASGGLLRECDEWFADAGWGRFDVVRLGSVLVVNHYDSPVATALRSLRPANGPVDDFFAGLFAEVLTQAHGQALEGVEISCLAAQAHYCRFVVGEASIIRKVYAWLTYHLDAQAILKRLADEAVL